MATNTRIPSRSCCLLTLHEARAAVELLQLLSASNGEGAYAARHLAGNLARRIPA
ncbi:hypothetical protein [Streptomyces albospinus]|uniref:hypothetical protein n=1 Tax=Streptomyces TaxID=1883 RepID=UPI00167066A4|nr:hypothetical protein [Streptomyces albospinus]